MSSRSVSVTLSANVSGFVSAMGRAASSVDQVTEKMSSVATKNAAEWDTVGSAMTKVGAVAAAGLGLAAKAAIDWESAFAGVRKTVDGSPEQIAALEGELRGMARTMATSHTEIAAVAEAAGQLGVRTEDVAGFTRTMIMLGETTNLTADQAATSLAQFMTIMGTAPDKVGNLGAALVGLGNNSATTESQILQMGQRIAGAGTAIGLTEAEVLGFAAAIASTGVEVEAGGTAISTTMFKMEQAVRSGGAELDLLAQTAGMSSEQFKTAFEEDAAGAITAFVEGLGRVQAAGGDVTGILTQLGITGIREADTLRRLANAGTLLGDSLEIANQSFTESSALMEEYQQRADTTASKIQVAWNNIKDAAITAGAVMLPAIASAAQAFAALAQAASGLPAPVRNALVALTAIVAAVGLFGGAAMRVIASVAALKAAVTTLVAAFRAGGAAATVAGAQMRSFGLQAAAAAVGLVALYNMSAGLTREIEKSSAGVDGYAQSLARLGSQGAAGLAALDEQVARFGDTSAMLGQGVKDTASLFDALAESSGVLGSSFKFLGDMLGLGSTLGTLRDEVGKLDQALTQMKPQDAAAAFKVLADQMTASGIGLEDQVGLFDDYARKIDELASAFGVTLTPLERYQAMMGQLPPKLQELASAASEASGNQGDLARELLGVGQSAQEAAAGFMALANAQMALDGSAIAVERSLAAVKDAVAENGRTLDVTTEKGRANQEVLLGIAASMGQYAKAQADAGVSGAELASVMDNNRARFIASAQAMGATRFEAEALADRYGLVGGQVSGLAGQVQDLGQKLAALPAETPVTIRGEGMETVQGSISDIKASLEGIPDDKPVSITLPNGEVVVSTAGEIRSQIDSLPPEKQIAFNLPGADEATQKTRDLAAALFAMPSDKPVTVTAPGLMETEAQVRDLAGVIAGVPDDKPVTITLANGETVVLSAGQVRAAIEAIPDREATITADPSGAISGAAIAQGVINAVVGSELPVDVDPSGAVAGSSTAQGAIDATHGKTNPVDVDPAGAVTGSRQAQGAIDATRGVTRDVDVDPSGAVSGSRTAQGAINSTHGVSRAISVTSNAASAAASAQASINSVRGKTVTINVIANVAAAASRALSLAGADGGLVPAWSGPAGPEWKHAKQYAGGGQIAGWSPHPKADNVPIWATAGEVMMSNAAGDIYGRDRLLALNAGRIDPRAFAAFMHAQGFAGGGQIQPAPSAPAAPAGRTINQYFTYNYPVGERESVATRRAASSAGLAAAYA